MQNRSTSTNVKGWVSERRWLQESKFKMNKRRHQKKRQGIRKAKINDNKSNIQAWSIFLWLFCFVCYLLNFFLIFLICLLFSIFVCSFLFFWLSLYCCMFISSHLSLLFFTKNFEWFFLWSFRQCVVLWLGACRKWFCLF